MGCWRSILEHWEMCSVRNKMLTVVEINRILEHWEMCSVRNHTRCSDSAI